MRGLWSLFVVEKLMQIVGDLEVELFHRQTPGNEERICSSFCPHPYPEHISHASGPSGPPESEPSCCRLPVEQRFLPCHYFDYIAGSSTGA